MRVLKSQVKLRCDVRCAANYTTVDWGRLIPSSFITTGGVWSGTGPSGSCPEGFARKTKGVKIAASRTKSGEGLFPFERFPSRTNPKAASVTLGEGTPEGSPPLRWIDCRHSQRSPVQGTMPTVTWNWMEPNGWSDHAAQASALSKPPMKPRAKPRGLSANPRETCKAPLHDSVELTPGGHRKHTLTRTSPGGTTRSTQYVSPRKGQKHYRHHL